MVSQVQCPKCFTIRDVVGTEIRVRCANKSCDHRFYTDKHIFVPKTTEKRDRSDSHGTVVNNKLPIAKMNGMVQSLIIALNYAINTIKNKEDVVAERVDSTRYAHYKSWIRIREYFQKLEAEKG